jgi:small conductance mechanosensitive channel
MELLARVGWVHILYAVGLLVIGFFVAQQLSAFTHRAASKRFSRHQAMLLRRLVFYVLLLIFVISALQELGFQMTVLLGTAGLLTVALGFASQTAASNLISGFFLLFERPFRIGDWIEIKDFAGSVESIDLLSTKIKTANNTLVRIPNETIMKSEITNTSFFKSRRIEILIPIPYKISIEPVKALLIELIREQPEILKDPRPEVILNKFADKESELKLWVWAKTRDASKVKNILYEVIKNRFDQDNILITVENIEER